MTDFSEDRIYARHPRYRGSACIIGVGSVGSNLAAKLAKLGFSPLYLVDRDVLEPENLARHYLGAKEIGQPKAAALAKRLRDELPTCSAFGEHVDFLDLEEEQQVALIRRAPVVVAATDSLECQRRINALCVANSVPAIYPGIWTDASVRDAEVGHILQVVPEDRTPCFQCYTSWRPQVAGDTEARGGSGLDIDNFSGIVAWAVVSLFYPEDEHSEIFDQARPLTLVHNPTSVSPAMRQLFTHGYTRNLRFPFPRIRCSACGGREAPPPRPRPATPPTNLRALQQRPPLARPPMSARPSTGVTPRATNQPVAGLLRPAHTAPSFRQPASRPNPNTGMLGAARYSAKPVTAISTPSPPSDLLIRILLFPARLVVGALAIATGGAFLVAPWLIMNATNQGNNIAGWGPVVIPAACGIWGLINIGLGLMGLALLPRVLVWIIAGKWLDD